MIHHSPEIVEAHRARQAETRRGLMQSFVRSGTSAALVIVGALCGVAMATNVAPETLVVNEAAPEPYGVPVPAVITLVVIALVLGGALGFALAHRVGSSKPRTPHF